MASGTLPSIIGRLRYLQSLDLSQNSFSGQLPPAWGELKKLEVISLSSNQELEGEHTALEGSIWAAFVDLVLRT